MKLRQCCTTVRIDSESALAKRRNTEPHTADLADDVRHVVKCVLSARIEIEIGNLP
jgi:hypothetical protein